MALLLTLTLIWACATAPPQQGPCTVAVWELENIGVSGAMADAGGLMTARVLETFQAAGRCATIEREKLTLALEELNLSASQLTDEDTRLRIGRMVGARKMVFGGYQVWGNTMRLDLRMVDVSTGAILQAATRSAAATDIAQWLDAAGQAARALGDALPPLSK